MEWILEIIGNDQDINLLSDAFNGPPYKIIKKSDTWLLESDLISSSSTPKEVKDLRDKCSMIFNGTLKLFAKSSSRELEIHFHGLDENGVKHGFGWADLTLPGVICEGYLGNAAPRLPSNLASVIEAYPVVREVFKLANECELSWDNLYKIYELIKSDCGSESNLRKKQYILHKNDLKRFKQTCNSPAVLGNKARHSVSKDKPPEFPMSLREAKEFIQSTSWGWIEEKATFIT